MSPIWWTLFVVQGCLLIGGWWLDIRWLQYKQPLIFVVQLELSCSLCLSEDKIILFIHSKHWFWFTLGLNILLISFYGVLHLIIAKVKVWIDVLKQSNSFVALWKKLRYYFINYVYFFSSDSVSDEVIGTHFIDLSRISNDGANGMWY